MASIPKVVLQFLHYVQQLHGQAYGETCKHCSVCSWVLLVCIKAIFNRPAQDLQQRMRQQQASQGTASARQLHTLLRT